MNLDNILTVKNTLDGYVVNDSSFVPYSTDNKDYQLIQQWIYSGGVAEPHEGPTIYDIIDGLKTQLTNYLNNEARAAGFFDLENAGKYTGYVNPFQSKAETLLTWVANFWITAQSIESDVLNGTRVMPDYNSLLAEILSINPSPQL